jgi:hypothetical protein
MSPTNTHCLRTWRGRGEQDTSLLSPRGPQYTMPHTYTALPSGHEGPGGGPEGKF